MGVGGLVLLGGLRGLCRWGVCRWAVSGCIHPEKEAAIASFHAHWKIICKHSHLDPREVLPFQAWPEGNVTVSYISEALVFEVASSRQAIHIHSALPSLPTGTYRLEKLMSLSQRDTETKSRVPMTCSDVNCSSHGLWVIGDGALFHLF